MAAENLGNTMLYVFYSTFQIIIFFSTGVIATKKQIISEKGRQSISAFVLNYLMCFFVIFEIGRVASMVNFGKYYIIIIITCTSLMLRYIVAYFSMKLFSPVCLKYQKTYLIGITFSQLGSLSLVLGRNLCFENGPFKGDKNCDSVLGIYILIQFIFLSVFFPSAYHHIQSDRNIFLSTIYKFKYMWYRIITKLNLPDYYCRDLFYDFINKEFDESLFTSFSKEHRLLCDENYNYKFVDNFSNSKNTKNEEEEEKINSQMYNTHHYVNVKYNLNSTESENESNDQSEIQEQYRFKKRSKSANHLMVCKNKLICDYNLIKNTETNKDILNRKQIKKYFSKIISFIKSENLKILVKLIKDKINIEDEHSLNLKIEVEKVLLKEVTILSDFKFLNPYLNSDDLHYIMNTTNDIIIKNEGLQKTIQKMEGHKSLIFNVSDAIKLDQELAKQIDEIWEEYDVYLKLNNKVIEDELKIIKIDFKYILGFVFNIVTISGIIGIFFGLSGLRDIVFSKNHYLTNIQNVLNVIAKAFVPMLFFLAGVSVSKDISLNVKMSLDKNEYYKQHIIGLILALFGLVIVLFWKNVFGQIVEESKMFQLAVYIPWALPAFNPTFLLILNKCGKFYFDESSFLLKNNSQFLLLSVFLHLLIYFLIF